VIDGVRRRAQEVAGVREDRQGRAHAKCAAVRRRRLTQLATLLLY